MLLEFELMLLDHTLADKFCAFDFAFVDDDLVVFAQLYFVVLDRLVKGLIFGSTFLDVVDDLQ